MSLELDKNVEYHHFHDTHFSKNLATVAVALVKEQGGKDVLDSSDGIIDLSPVGEEHQGEIASSGSADHEEDTNGDPTTTRWTDGSASGGPTFDPTTDRNVTVLVGRTAQLHCRVRNLGNRTVSCLIFIVQ